MEASCESHDEVMMGFDVYALREDFVQNLLMFEERLHILLYESTKQ